MTNDEEKLLIRIFEEAFSVEEGVNMTDGRMEGWR